MMPIGVPKVAYRVPGSQGAEWVDIYNRLYRERIVFIGSEIDDELANQVIGVMLYLDSEDSDKPIYLYINSPGGSVISGLAIYDCMQHIKVEATQIMRIRDNITKMYSMMTGQTTEQINKD